MASANSQESPTENISAHKASFQANQHQQQQQAELLRLLAQHFQYQFYQISGNGANNSHDLGGLERLAATGDQSQLLANYHLNCSNGGTSSTSGLQDDVVSAIVNNPNRQLADSLLQSNPIFNSYPLQALIRSQHQVHHNNQQQLHHQLQPTRVAHSDEQQQAPASATTAAALGLERYHHGNNNNHPHAIRANNHLTSAGASLNLLDTLGLNLTGNQFSLSLQQQQQQQQQQALLQAAAAAAAAAETARQQFETTTRLGTRLDSDYHHLIAANVANLVRQHQLSNQTNNILPQHQLQPREFNSSVSDIVNNKEDTLKFSISNILGSPPRVSPRTNSTEVSQRGEDEHSKTTTTTTTTTTSIPKNKSSSRSKKENHVRLSNQSPLTCDTGSTALNSLSNFVSESLAPIMSEQSGVARLANTLKSSSFSGGDYLFSGGGSNKSSISPTGSSKSNTSFSINNNNIKNSNSQGNGMIRKHQSTSESGPAASGGTGNASSNATFDLISSAAQALKNPAPVTTVNTALAKAPKDLNLPAWVFCTRYSDRPSSGPRTRRAKSKDKKVKDPKATADEKRPRTAFTSGQLEKLRQEFQANSYLDEKRRKDLAERLSLNENQIKIWFQNKRAKMKKQNNQPNPLRGLLVAGGLYNHSTATSDCSESYANGNDHEDSDDDMDGDEERDQANNQNHCNGVENLDNHRRGDEIDDCVPDNGTAAAAREQDSSSDRDGCSGIMAAGIKRNRISVEDNENDEELDPSSNKRTKLTHGVGSEGGSESSSRAGYLDLVDEDEERVISVS